MFIAWTNTKNKQKTKTHQIRSKRKTEITRRKKIRPCLKVCQKVEEQCPYLLPGDRAPGYNTQYAGEPTFLCTGNHLASFIIISTSSFCFKWGRQLKSDFDENLIVFFIYFLCHFFLMKKIK